jgi:hypothetical protein
MKLSCHKIVVTVVAVKDANRGAIFPGTQLKGAQIKNCSEKYIDIAVN